MVTLAFSAILVGTALGMRFKVLILLPTTAIELAALAAAGAVTSSGLTSIVVEALLAIIGLQVGYLLGLTIRYVAEKPKVAQTRASRSPV